MIMDKKLVYLFCLESLLGGITTAIENKDKEKIIKIVISRAERDALTGGRFSSSYLEKKEEYKETLKNSVLTKEILSSKDLIKELMGDKKCDNNLGFIQKLVNMTLKYLLVIKLYGYEECVPNISEDECDCPLDSIILNNLNMKNIRWTKLKSLDEYENIQNNIGNYYKSKIEYDFQKWRGGI